MRKVLIVGGDAFLIAAMRLSLRYVSGVNVLAIREDEDRLAETVRDVQPDIVVIEARGEPEDPEWEALVAAKFDRHARGALGPEDAMLQLLAGES